MFGEEVDLGMLEAEAVAVPLGPETIAEFDELVYGFVQLLDGGTGRRAQLLGELDVAEQSAGLVYEANTEPCEKTSEDPVLLVT